MILYQNITEESFGLALDLAKKKLTTLNPEELCKKTGASLLDPTRIILPYFSRPHVVDLRNGQISLQEDPEIEIPLKDRILILHYLTQAKGTPWTHRLITYAQIQGGRFYCPAFQKRTIEPILNAFGNQPENLVEIAQEVGGERASYGDASVAFYPFPFVKIVIVIWRGDEEVSPNGNILFDRNITDYLSAEDIAVVSETLIWKLIRRSNS